MADGVSDISEESDGTASPISHPRTDLIENSTSPPGQVDPEDPQQSRYKRERAGARCAELLRIFGKYVGFVILAIIGVIGIVVLGVLNLIVFFVVLLELLLLDLCRSKVALLLLMPLISLLLGIFRVHSSLKHGTIGGLETWRWLEIALVSCVLCNIWMVGGLLFSTFAKSEHGRSRKNLIYFTGKLIGAFNCMCLIVGELIVVNKVAPTFKESVPIFGLALWKWILALVSLVCASYLIPLKTHLIVVLLEKAALQFENGYNAHKFFKRIRLRAESETRESLRKPCTLTKCIPFLMFRLKVLWQILKMTIWIPMDPDRIRFPLLAFLDAPTQSTRGRTLKKYAVFMARGLRARINILLFFISILLTWIFYIKPQLHLEKSSKAARKALHLVVQSYLCLLIAAALSLVKKFFLLLWEAREIYKKFAHKIMRAYTQMYLLAKICISAADRCGDNVMFSDQDVKRSKELTADGEYASFLVSQFLRKECFSYDILKRIASVVEDADNKLVSHQALEELRKKWPKYYHPNDDRYRRMTDGDDLTNSIEEHYGCELDVSESEYLYEEMKNQQSLQGHVEYIDFENWMRKAHTNCTQLGATLASFPELIVYLNRIITGFILVACILIWLFVTQVATIKLIVLVTSPLLAVTFIFGDTAKTLFQGIIFAYAVHPFDVGDICIVDGNQLIVKKIRIWKTAFYRRGSEYEEVWYPNSILINTAIIKHDRNLAVDDNIEFSVQFDLEDYGTEDEAIDMLTEKIKQLKTEEDPELSIQHVSVKDIDQGIKMVVHFKYKKIFEFMNDEECSTYKIETRSKLLRSIRRLIHQVKEKFKTRDLCLAQSHILSRSRSLRNHSTFSV